MNPYENITKEKMEKVLEDIFSNIVTKRKYKMLIWFPNEEAEKKFFDEFDKSVKKEIDELKT